MKKIGTKSAISRTATIVVVIVVIAIIAVGGYVGLVLNQGTTTTTTSSTTTSTGTGSSSTTGTSTTSKTSTTSSTSPAKNITVELLNPTGSIDPFKDHGSAQQVWVGSNMYESLFYFNGTSNAVVPWLATGYTVNSGANVWNFTLRQGVTFSDGTPFNATAVKDSIDWEIIAHNGGGATGLASVIRGAPAFIASQQTQQNITDFVNGDGITILSTYEVEFNLSQPFVSLLTYFSNFYYTYMLSPTAIMANGGVTPGSGSTWLETHSAGTGPYVLSSYDSNTGTVVLTKNAHYWGAKTFGVNPPFPEVTINIVPNPATEELDVRTGVADMIFLPHSELYDFADKTTWTTQHQLVSTVPNTQLWGPYATPSFYAFMLNAKIYLPNGSLAAVQPFQNPDMIKAFNYAWNESYYVESVLNGLGIANPGLLMQGELGYQNYTPYFQENLTAAANEITKACQALGCSPNNPLHIVMAVINDPDSEGAASLLASNINSLQAGVRLDLNPGTFNAALSFFLSKTEGVFLGEFSTNPVDPLVSPLGFFGNINSGFAAIFTYYNDSNTISLLNQA
ncbi:MAG: ABC transporter substrate-binding protein, partial [Thaumarchaeota archaeon]|nr:ABC transporter substrate-binding protein [Nitrososphaerota archaeon]